MSRLFCLLLALLCLSSAWAADPISLQLAALEDPDKRLDLQQVLEAGPQAGFTTVNRGFSGGYSRSAFWFRLTLGASPAPADGLLEIQPPYLDDLRLYVPDASQPGGYRERRGGDLLALAERDYQYRSTVFRLPAQVWDNGPLYLRLETTSSALLIAKLWATEDFQSAKITEYGALGLYYGLLLTLILVLLWQGLWRREVLFRAFVLYAVSMLVFLLGVNGLASQFVWPAHPEIGHYWTQYSSFLMYACGAWFYRLVLQIDEHTPWLNSLYRAIQYSCLLMLPTPLLDWYVEAVRVAISLMLLLTCLGLWRSVQLWYAGQRSAGLLALAHGFTLGGALSVILAMLGWLPGELWLVHGYQIGSLASILAFAQVMAWRVRAMESQWREEQLRAQRYQQQSQLDVQARRQQADFISLLSHEVRTPLAMIDGAVQSLQLLQADAVADVQQRHGRIRRGVRRINELLEQFLQSERLDARGIIPTRNLLDVSLLCRQAIATQALDDRVHLHVTAQHLCADGPLLQTALSNLLANAEKYSSAGSPITLAVLDDGLAVSFRVSDQGSGILDEHLSRVFERFYRVPQGQGGEQGSGLGLYMVQRIAELHGGTIVAQRLAQGGMCFTLCIPHTEQTLP